MPDSTVGRLTQDRLDKCKGALSLLDKKVVELKSDFAKRTAEAESLKRSLGEAEEVLGAAQELLEKLSGERERWDHTMKGLLSASSALPAHSILSAGFLAYLPDEQATARLGVGWGGSKPFWVVLGCEGVKEGWFGDV